MRKSLAIPAAVAATTLTLAACGSSGNDNAEGDWPDEITMSLVPSIQGEDLAEALDPLTEYLSEGLGIEVNGVVANDYAATVEALGADQSQVIITDAGSLFNAMEQFNAELILRDVRFGATSYAAQAVTNNPDKYCEDEVVTATYEASGDEFSYCNGTEPGDQAGGEGPAGLEALGKIDAGTKIAMQSATSPAGYQYPIVSMKEQGIDTDNDIEQIPVEGNNNAILSVYNGDAEIGFAYWDARVDVLEEAPDISDEVVVFAYTEMIPNGGVAVTPDLPDDLVAELTELMDAYAGSSDEAAEVMFDLVGLSDWTDETDEDEITRYGEVRSEFSG